MTLELFFAIASSIWLGILTSISPCPLATNIVAISYIGERVGHARSVLLTGLLYTAGRALVYTVLGMLLVSSLLSAPAASQFLQRYMNKLLGPCLIIIGMMLTGLIAFSISSSGVSERLGKRVERWGIWGGLALGVVFALSFCPASAGLFFGSLLSLSIKHESSILLPMVYGISTGVPVFVFAILIATSTRAVGQAYNKIAQFEWWARHITGTIFILVGVYFCLVYIYHVL